jgi:hypothetical protein
MPMSIVKLLFSVLCKHCRDLLFDKYIDLNEVRKMKCFYMLRSQEKIQIKYFVFFMFSELTMSLQASRRPPSQPYLSKLPDTLFTTISLQTPGDLVYNHISPGFPHLVYNYISSSFRTPSSQPYLLMFRETLFTTISLQDSGHIVPNHISLSFRMALIYNIPNNQVSGWH